MAVWIVVRRHVGMIAEIPAVEDGNCRKVILAVELYLCYLVFRNDEGVGLSSLDIDFRILGLCDKFIVLCRHCKICDGGIGGAIDTVLELLA